MPCYVMLRVTYEAEALKPCDYQPIQCTPLLCLSQPTTCISALCVYTTKHDTHKQHGRNI